eukprot:TRINITY_DN12859_c0_g1_i5.p1 TRINITY_DN12859_c0_g1~~TRINITY_DN12859_c0_g1_i5.p1  ORF type:complete len:347 (+),score=48.98 TRINITY_DN12859_c0_g1_i5:147-1187(+)
MCIRDSINAEYMGSKNLSENNELQSSTMKKELEGAKTLALQEQKISFLEEKISNLNSTLQTKDSEISLLNHKLSEAENLHKQEEPRTLQSTQRVNSDELVMQNTVLQKQLEILQSQNKENTKIYESLTGAIQKGLEGAMKKEAHLTNINKELEAELDQVQQRCATLEARLYRMRKYRAIIYSARSIECKGCGRSFASNLFGAHVKLCQRAACTHEDDLNCCSSRHSARTSRQNSPRQEYTVHIKFNGEDWTIRKTLYDFARLSEDLSKEYPSFRIPSSMGLFEDRPISPGGTSCTRKQKYLEAYLRELIQNENIRETKRMKEFLGLSSFKALKQSFLTKKLSLIHI